MTTGNWYLVSATFNGSTLTVYQDGAAVGSVAATTATGSTTLYIGGNGGSVSSFNGTIDEVRYYSTALSGAQDVTGATDLVGGSDYSSAPTVTFSGGGATGTNVATASVQMSGTGSAQYVSSLTIINAGSGYTSIPTISFTGGLASTNGANASAFAALSVSQLSYLYAQSGPQIEDTYIVPEDGVVEGTTATLTTAAISHEEASNATDLTFTWSTVTVPPDLATQGLQDPKLCHHQWKQRELIIFQSPSMALASMSST